MVTDHNRCSTSELPHVQLSLEEYALINGSSLKNMMMQMECSLNPILGGGGRAVNCIRSPESRLKVGVQ